ncbi:hypothetical protein ACG02S_15300 [Roseateles sp. DC23W]|uniref:Uncharacterized protein n=1 Tax=Pelomonas dachongensis TaxID=3299029 RepID=A0ABW7EQ22_9BURK
MTTAAVTRLQQQRDPRALAVADYLLAGANEPDSDAARARLHDRARASADPLLTVLALHKPCSQPGCRSIEAAQWSRLEPDNLLAWLVLPTTAGDSDYLLDQIASRVRLVRDYRREAAAVVDGSTGGVLGDSWPLLNLRSLAVSCPRDLHDATRAQRCEKVADLLWSGGGAVERLMALTLMQGVQRLQPERRALWGPRLQEVTLALRRLPDGQVIRPGPGALCDLMTPPGSAVLAASDDWRRAWQVLAASGVYFDPNPDRRYR